MLHRVKNYRTWPRRLRRSAEYIADSEAIAVRWPSEGFVKENWGDKLNPVLLRLMTGRPVYNRLDLLPYASSTTYVCIGSSLGSTTSDEIVWGHGFMSEDVPVNDRAREIFAVRGPLSHQKLVSSGIKCPHRFGDPALLVPKYFRPAEEKKYDIGLVRQIRDSQRKILITDRSCLDIDICGSIEDVIRDITSCRCIVSSSLHGIICAHAYGIPATWIYFRGGERGDSFKFRDYLMSVDVTDPRPSIVDDGIGVVRAGEEGTSPSILERVEDLTESFPIAT